MNNSGKRGIPSLLFLLHLFHALVPLSSAQQSSTPDPRYANMKFSPSLAIILAVLICALFFMVFVSLYIRRCSNSTSSGANVHAITGQNRSRLAISRGLDHEVIETFPTFAYSEVKSLKLGKGALECAVCLNEFEDDETLRLIPKCDHVFHSECVDTWLESHTTCPVCRANLVHETGESVAESQTELDLEAQNAATAAAAEPQQQNEETQVTHPPEPQVINLVNPTLNRNRTRRFGSYRPRKFPRSHSTGHSLIQPGENTERFTLRLPVDVRKQIMNRQLNRSKSLVVLPRESSAKRGYRTGGEGSSRGKSSSLLDRSFKSDRWVFNMAPSFLSRALSVRSTKVAADDVNETPGQAVISSGEPNRPTA